MGHPSSTLALLVCLATALPCTVLAAGSQKLEITSDSLEMDDHSRTAIFTGHVQATDQEMKLSSERMIVRYHGNMSEGNSKGVQDVRAEGHVLIQVGDRQGKGDSALYKVNENILELMSTRGKAVVQRGEDWLEGKRIIIHLSKDRRIERVSALGGGGRVSARIAQQDSPTAPGKSAPAKSGREE